MDINVDIKIKKSIINLQLNEVAQQTYDAVIRKRVADKVGSEAESKQLTEVLVKLEKKKDAINEILLELEAIEKDTQSAR